MSKERERRGEGRKKDGREGQRERASGSEEQVKVDRGGFEYIALVIAIAQCPRGLV